LPPKSVAVGVFSPAAFHPLQVKPMLSCVTLVHYNTSLVALKRAAIIKHCYLSGRMRNAELKKNAKNDTGKQSSVLDKMTSELQQIYKSPPFL